MLCMVSYSRRPQSGQITCYLNRTYHVLLTLGYFSLDMPAKRAIKFVPKIGPDGELRIVDTGVNNGLRETYSNHRTD